MGKRVQLQFLSDTLTGEWGKGKAGDGQGSEGDSATRQGMCHEGHSTRSWWGRYHLARAGGPPGPKGV